MGKLGWCHRSCLIIIALAFATLTCSSDNTIKGSFPTGQISGISLTFANDSTSVFKVADGSVPYLLTLRNKTGADFYNLSASVVSGSAGFTGGSFPGNNGNCTTSLVVESGSSGYS
ncbi:MAG: hypothetical protein KDD35_08535 [Bdellovibrionales bacterium]|nr:hypothetical protein [Bdellovibrionales bacterium]